MKGTASYGLLLISRTEHFMVASYNMKVNISPINISTAESTCQSSNRFGTTARAVRIKYRHPQKLCLLGPQRIVEKRSDALLKNSKRSASLYRLIWDFDHAEHSQVNTEEFSTSEQAAEGGGQQGEHVQETI